jgi:hypothetical protein
MQYTQWLRRQVARLEQEIKDNPALDGEQPATTEALRSLRETVVLHTYLKQQLLRRERLDARDEIDTKEVELTLVYRNS